VARILVVDDQAEIRRLLQVTLRDEHEVRLAHSGADALLLLRGFMPDVILLDIMMPGEIDGLRVLDHVKADVRRCHIPVAIISARGQVVDREEARARGADAYFIKPFSPLQVAAWVSSRLAGRPTHHDLTPPPPGLP
jgi:CheY-like chemotaxis protein